MADRRRGRRTSRQRGLIGPLVMLAGGVAAGVFLWRMLMLDAGPVAAALAERAGGLLAAPPVIEQVDVLAAKLPDGAPP